MKYLYVVLGIIGIFIVTFFTFYEDNIYYNYAKFKVENNNKLLKGAYYYEDNFYYLDDYDGLEIHNKDELYETIYYVINSGSTSTKRYFDIHYTNFEEDYNEIFSEKNQFLLNNINNFVHPYNTFNAINVNLKGYELSIDIEYKDTYPEEKRKLIDDKVDELISTLITNDMNDKTKVKTIHDYIINNTIYDKDFCIEENEEDCMVHSSFQSDTAYGVLFEHRGICSGYTDLMAIFLHKLGIVNYRVTNDSHTWNAVKIDNRWYHLDATWDDPISEKDILTHTYFLITTYEDTLLEEVHTFDKEIFIELS